MKMLDKEKIAEILREKHPYLVSEYGIRRIGLQQFPEAHRNAIKKGSLNYAFVNFDTINHFF